MKRIYQGLTNILSKNYFPFCLMLIVIASIYYSVLIGRVWMKWDMYQAIFPSYVTISAAIQHGTLPLWDAFQNRGVPIANLMGIPVWFPITLVLGTIGVTQELMQLLYIIIVLLAGIFTYLALGNYLNNRWLCAIGGIAYATSGQFVSNAQHITFITAAALLPLIHYATRKWIKEQKVQWLILLGLGIGLLILNNYPPFIVITAIVIIFELLFSIKEIKRDANNLKLVIMFVLSSIIVIFVSFLVGFVSLYTNLKVISEITREGVSWEIATGASMNVWNWLGAISPILVQASDQLNTMLDLSMSNAYIALPLLILALIRKPKTKQQLLLVLLCIIGFLLSMGQNAFGYRFIFEFIPGMDSFQFPAGLRYVYFYYLTLLGMFNLGQIVEEGKYKEALTKVLRGLLLVYTILLVIVLLNWVMNTGDNILLKEAVAELFWSALLVGMISLALSYFKHEKYYIVGLAILIISFSFLGVWRNDEYTIGTNDRPKAYESQIRNIYNSPSENLISNKYVEGKLLSFPDSVFYQQFQTGGYVGSFELKSFNNALQNELLPAVDDPVVWTVADNAVSIVDSFLITKGVEKTSISDYVNYRPNVISGNVDLTQSGYLILEQTSFPGWLAEVNGNKTEFIPTDSGVIAIKVDKGQTAFYFEFKPIGTIIAAYISFITWLILLLYLTYKLVKRAKRQVATNNE
jgi:uncharacterized membrane protein YfhO